MIFVFKFGCKTVFLVVLTFHSSLSFDSGVVLTHEPLGYKILKMKYRSKLITHLPR